MRSRPHLGRLRLRLRGTIPAPAPARVKCAGGSGSGSGQIVPALVTPAPTPAPFIWIITNTYGRTWKSIRYTLQCSSLQRLRLREKCADSDGSGCGCGSASTLKKRWPKSAENVENRVRSAQQKILHPKAGRWIRQWTHVSLHFLNILTFALLGGGVFEHPPPCGFSRIARKRRRAAPPGFHLPYPPSFWQLLWKFRSWVMQGQVTRSGQVTIPYKNFTIAPQLQCLRESYETFGIW